MRTSRPSPSARRTIALCLLMLAAGTPAADTITTVVGGGIGDGHPAANNRIRSGTRAIVDSAGNIYFTEYSTQRVRKIAVGTGILSTIAGTGTAGTAGTGGPATSAQVSDPAGLALDATETYLYIADRGTRNVSGNHRICRVHLATGILTLVAGNGTATFAGDGGQATDASLHFPSGIAFDAAGNLYIADQNNHRVRKVAVGTNIITTVAGSSVGATYAGDGGQATSASLNQPNAIAFDAAGDMYIADEYNHRVRKVVMSGPSTGIISTVVGTGTWGFSGDGFAATSAQLHNTGDVWFDPTNGDLYIADAFNHRVRVVSGGIINTVAGGGSYAPPINGDGGAATSAWFDNFWSIRLTKDANRDMIIADYFNNRIRKVTRATGIITSIAGAGIGDGQPATSTSLRRVVDVAFDAAGNQFVVDEFDCRVRKVDAATGDISTVAGKGGSGFSGDGLDATLALLGAPTSAAADGFGNLYIADRVNDRIRKVVLGTGIISTYAGGGVAAVTDGAGATTVVLANPRAVAVDGSGNLLIADGARVYRVDRIAETITTIAGNGGGPASGDGGQATAAGLGTVADICFDASGNLLIAADGLRKVTGGIISTISPTLVAYGIAVRANGRIYASSPASSSQVVEVDPVSGATTAVAGDGTPGFAGDDGDATVARLDTPSGLAVDGAGRLHIADWTNGRVRRVTFAAPPPGGGGGGGAPSSDGGGSCGVGGGAAVALLMLLGYALSGGLRRRQMP